MVFRVCCKYSSSRIPGGDDDQYDYSGGGDGDAPRLQNINGWWWLWSRLLGSRWRWWWLWSTLMMVMHQNKKIMATLWFFPQTMYAGKYMNMYGLPGAGGTEQVAYWWWRWCHQTTMMMMMMLKMMTRWWWWLWKWWCKCDHNDVITRLQS